MTKPVLLRTQPAIAAEVSTTRNVFCKDCRHFRPSYWCHADTKIDPIKGEVPDEKRADERNVNMNCGRFDAIPAKPWWRFW